MEETISFSLKKILQLPILAGVRVHAGKSGLSRPVMTTNVIEVLDSAEWAEKGQLLITTGYALRDDSSALEKLLPELEKAGIAGLGIKTGRYLDEIPAEALALAESMSFPIFEIPPALSLSHIVTAISKQFVDRETRALQESHNLHESITFAMLKGGNLEEICNILHSRFGNSVAINSELYSSFVINTTPDKYQDVYGILLNIKQSYTKKVSCSATGIQKVEGDVLGGVVANRIIIPICSDQDVYGRIYLWEDDHKISGMELSSIASITNIVAIDILKKMTILEMENNHKSGFLDDLLCSDSRRHQKAFRSARCYDFNPDKPHQVVIVRPKNSNKDTKLNGIALLRSNALVAGILFELAKKTPIKILYVNNENCILVLCELPESTATSKTGSELRAFLENLSRVIKNDSLGDNFVIGVGRRYDHYTSLFKSLMEARRAVRCHYAAKADSNIVFYEELGLLRLLSNENLYQESALFAEEMLGALIAYDRDKDSELIKTLEAYFECKGNMAKISKEMGLHYNTINYRLQRIEELTGYAFENTQSLLNLQIALKILEMQNNE